jgi:uncharacterized DUF497 family protein
MMIVWDEPKRQANVEKHGLDFADLTLDFLCGRPDPSRPRWPLTGHRTPR